MKAWENRVKYKTNKKKNIRFKTIMPLVRFSRSFYIGVMPTSFLNASLPKSFNSIKPKVEKNDKNSLLTFFSIVLLVVIENNFRIYFVFNCFVKWCLDYIFITICIRGWIGFCEQSMSNFFSIRVVMSQSSALTLKLKKLRKRSSSAWEVKYSYVVTCNRFVSYKPSQNPAHSPTRHATIT